MVKPVHVTRCIRAPLELVFETISDVRNFSQAVPHIIEIEFLTKQQYGVGTQFRETRQMNGKPQTVELEVAELVENDRVRMVSDAGGTIWDTLFTVSQGDNSVELNLVMDVKPHRFLARIITPLIRGMVVKGVETDMDAVKAYCESHCDQNS